MRQISGNTMVLVLAFTALAGCGDGGSSSTGGQLTKVRAAAAAQASRPA